MCEGLEPSLIFIPCLSPYKAYLCVVLLWWCVCVCILMFIYVIHRVYMKLICYISIYILKKIGPESSLFQLVLKPSASVGARKLEVIPGRMASHLHSPFSLSLLLINLLGIRPV